MKCYGSNPARAGSLAGVVLLATLGVAQARSYVYQYTGTAYTGNTSGCLAGTPAKHLTFVMSLAAKLPPNYVLQTPPLSWSFNDGVDVFKSTAKGANSYISVSTDANGNILHWDVSGHASKGVGKSLYNIATSFNGDYFNEAATDGRCHGGGYGETFTAGTWTGPK